MPVAWAASSVTEPTGIYTATATDPNNNTSNFSTVTSIPVTPPSATTLTTTGVTTTAATLSGSVNPEGVATTVTFVYGTDPTLTTGTTTTAGKAIGSGTSSVALTAALTGLQPGRTYYDEVVATSASGKAKGAIVSFTTLAAPVATTQASSIVSTTAGTLNASVNPEGSATTVRFIYGTNPTLLTGTTTTTGQAIGSGTSPVAVTAALTGLQPGTTYYDEVVGTSAGGTTPGAIVSFTTPGPAAATKLVVTREPPNSVTPGSTFTLAVSAEDGSGSVEKSYMGSVVLVLSSSKGTLGGTTTVASVDGVATFTGLTLSPAGTYTIEATSGQLMPVSVTPITVSALAVVDGPKVVSVLRYGYHMMPTSLVLSFDQALDAITAEDDANYRIIGPSGRALGIRSAVYDPATLTVTLHPIGRINIHHTYKLIVNGTAPHGLTNTTGELLDGADKALPTATTMGS